MIKQADESYRAPELEARVRALWEERGAYEQTVAHRSEGERYGFVDGPPYTTGSVHVGTARNKIIKDTVLRWLRMRGYHVRDQPGYDMHGLPIEVLVERSLGLTNKRQIEEEVGVAKFVETCRDYALGRLENQTQEFRDLGVWMDWDHPYMTITNDYIESAWWTIQRAAERDLLMRAKRSLEWCPRCETPVAGYEIEFSDETDPSIYVRFPLADESASLLIWTTTPWTLPANMAVAVHPDFTYALVEYGAAGAKARLWVVEENVQPIMEAGGVEAYEILKTASGTDLVGLAYDHPLREEVPRQTEFTGEWQHRVLPSDTVTLEFTGLVHTAPGHGPEDFEIGREHDLAPFSPLEDGGRFTAEGGKYEGLPTTEANAVILKDLEAKGLLFHAEDLVHRYGHCWRCETPIVYRATDQWFIRVTEVKDRMLEEVARVVWTPEWAGSARQYDWVRNAKDWTISRQRYWGTPLPIWECPEGHLRIVGATQELTDAEGYDEGMDLHRPWIDEVTLACAECGETMTRIPDVLDVWFDSAVASWASLGYPAQKEAFETWWPAPWIVEAHDQTRGWFYSQLGAGVVAYDRCPYDSVLMHGWVWPPEGEAFSKSRGDALTPGDVAAELGNDALRFYELKAAAPWDDFAFLVEEIRNAQRTLNILWNVHRFASLYMALDDFDPTQHPLGDLSADLAPEDRWMLSRELALIADVAQALSTYELHRAARHLEDFIVRDLSRWYVRLIRDRLWVEGVSRDKVAAYATLHRTLQTTAALLAPMCPFITEAIYQDLGGPHPTVHMEDWPTPDGILMGFRDETLEGHMATVRLLVEEVARQRQSRSYKLRWPVGRVVIAPADEPAQQAIEALTPILQNQTNAKAIEVLAPGASWEALRLELHPLEAAIGQKYKSWLPAIVDALSRVEAEEVQEALAKGSFEVQIEGQPFQVTADMVRFEQGLPEEVTQGTTPTGTVFVDFQRTPEIEAEGFARELVRRVQQMRKELDLSVDDYIETRVQTGEVLGGYFQEWAEYIERETRTRQLTVSPASPKGALVKEWRVDGEQFTVSVTKAR